jgi:hypothetical protein
MGRFLRSHVGSVLFVSAVSFSSRKGRSQMTCEEATHN